MQTKLTVALSATALCLGAAPAAGAATAHSNSSAPVIHERFTTLPCKGLPAHRTTIELEGCAEHQVLKRDKQIDTLAAKIYAKLSSSGRSTFTTASTDWLSYRNAYCKATAAPAAGGTEATVIDAQCLAKQDSEHVTDLHTFLQDAFAS